MKDSVAHRGSVLWNTLTSKYTDLVDANHHELAKKLKTSELFEAIKFNLVSASTTSFVLEDFVYI